MFLQHAFSAHPMVSGMVLSVIVLALLLASAQACVTSDPPTTPEVAPSPGGDSPPQNKLPPIPAPVRSSCGHNQYYHYTGDDVANIVGGIDAAPHEYPWLVRLKISLGDGTSDLCGAAIINDQWLLTVAHCVVVASAPDRITAVFGDWDKKAVDDGEYSMLIKTIKLHDKFKTGIKDYDLALLKLPSRIPLDTWNVQPICLPTSCDDRSCSEGTRAYIAGWGTRSEEGKTSSRILQKAYIRIANFESCKKIYQAASTIVTDRMMCAGWPNGGVDACLGDSGGPLMVVEDGYYKLCGLISFGIGCARVGYYGVYA